MVTSPNEGTFSIDVPNLSTKLAQGESKNVAIDIRRGKNFDQEVKLSFQNVPKGVTIDHAQYEQAGSEIDRLLGNTVARLAFGDSTAKRRSVPDDNQLVHAIDALKQSTTQKDLFAIAQREQSTASASAR